MSTQLAYPSADFPGPVGVGIDQPEGWQPLPDVAVPLALAKDVEAGAFRPNVIVIVSRVRRQYGLEQAVAELLGKLTGVDGYTEIGREERDVAGFPGFRVEASFPDAQGGTLAQAVRLTVVDRGPVLDMVQTTGTCAGHQMAGTWPEIRAIQDSLRITA
ncbi:LpqN/LpqT family lipoprotein [Oerskovia flava]|uniref:LpqN/LpqT family lipoprotein n=1 Tax=Oerskovia flava TaxID=2986422 RepID=UPI00223FAF87|nr:LpqN/LpqT family lipoprotein [Oerskovia sp. JB1-3-2]